MANATNNLFEDLLGDYKTYIVGGLGIVTNALAQFGIWNPTSDQLMSVNGILVMAAAIFIRAGIKKAQRATEAKAAEIKAVVRAESK